MKRFSLLMLLAAATFALTGCVITDYPCITDTENPNYADCTATAPNVLHDTKGWAHILESGMTATDNDGDGDFSQFIPFVSQDSAGIGSLMAMAQNAPSSEPWTWHTDGKWDGGYGQGAQKDPGVYAYAIYTNSNYPSAGTWDGRPGNTGDITGSCIQSTIFDQFPFDYQFGTACEAADFDVSALTSYFTRTGEVGRSASPWGVPLATKMALLQHANVTEDGLEFTFDSELVTVTVMQGANEFVLDTSMLDGRVFTINPEDKHIIGNEWWAASGGTPETYLAMMSQFDGVNRGEPVTLHVEFDGHSFDYSFALPHSLDWYQNAAAYGTAADTVGGRRR